jgi:hypothetical protein
MRASDARWLDPITRFDACIGVGKANAIFQEPSLNGPKLEHASENARKFISWTWFAAKLDEAEAAARDLLRRFPDVHDGWDRLGMVHETRGDSRQAADCYRKVIDFIRHHPDRYDTMVELHQARRQTRSASRHLSAGPSLALNEGAGYATICNRDQSAENCSQIL